MNYNTIVADPPWPYTGQGPVGNGGRGTQGGKAQQIIQVGVKQHYPTMSIEAIKALGVKDVAGDNAHLYLWTTNSFMVEAHEIARAWGFAPKTILTWVKVHQNDPTRASMKTGYYFRSATEHIVFAVRGSLRNTGPCRPTAFMLPRAPHSVKPDFFYELAEEQSPGAYLELFARRPRAGWDQWGNEINSTFDFASADGRDVE
jgi:N6-adenosine-specific RNA methylase IME4